MNMKYVLILVMCLSKLCPSQTAVCSMCVYFAVLIGLSRVRASVYLCASLAVFLCTALLLMSFMEKQKRT